MRLLKIRVPVLVLALGVVAPSMANATALVFNPAPIVDAFPDIRSNAQSISYSAAGVCSFLTYTASSAGCLQITGFNINLTPPQVGNPLDPGPVVNFSGTGTNTFNLFANIDSTGTLKSGVLQIVGGLTGAAPYSQPNGTQLLFGNLTQFGLQSSVAGPDTFTFLASVTDPLGLGFGSLVGVQVSTNRVPGLNPFGGSFTFANGNEGPIDTFKQTAATVPEPGSFLLLATGGALLVLRKRFRRRPTS